MKHSAYDIILWDWNGTLLDDGLFGVGIINGMLRRRGMAELSRDEHRDLFDFPVLRYYERLGFDFEAEPFEVISQEFVDAYIAGVRSCSLREGTHETLTALRACGIRQSVLSASRQDYLDALIAHFGLEAFFEELLGIDSVHAPGKSDRGLGWINKSGINPERVLLIGDTLHDAEVAREMTIDCWLLEGGHHPSHRLAQAGVPCKPDLPSILNALNINPSKTFSA